MNRRTRGIYNTFVYTLLRCLFFWSPSIEFFPDANGDCLTFRYGIYVYKTWNIPFLFRPQSPFRDVVVLHRELQARGLAEYMPRFKTSRWCIAYEYIAHSQDLIHALLEESSTAGRVELLSRTLSLVGRMHGAGILHGDLKPKNILVAPNGRLYLIDLEDLALAGGRTDQTDDYRKLIPRLIYLFTAEEIHRTLVEASIPESMRVYIERYLENFDCRKIIAGIKGLRFEHAEDVPGEDVDIFMPSAASISAIVECIRAARLDSKLFFRSCDDAKLYVYNLSGVTELDIHLAHPLSRFALMREKTRRHPPSQIAATGPDGVGKTTLLTAIHEHPRDKLLARFPMRFIHASRFVREGWTAPVGKWTLRERIAARWRGSLFWQRIAYNRLLRRNTTPLVLLDRSFYDPFLQGNAFERFIFPLWRFFLPRDVRTVLLAASPTTITTRKPQLSATAVEEYYRRAATHLPAVAVVNVEGSAEEAQEHLERLFRFFTLTQKYFLPR